ncbi:insecticidal delta-endotoxin Cry8Ea1 family protein [Bacillus thuringiensis]|uniref:insecticidal delta-endotoxin Cry8Ea1 family protein n=1 Tax=Bacillus thuringiensis TaxID=1428 RepID=UPI000902450A|nr:insecticidal delta-endotoxin Cry8Ea1 family protein [Bacillus thuringiensis]PGW46196.1 hypothetical protein COE03_15620 [Bacillus thuringiensis]
MAQLRELQTQSIIPYNILATPPIGNADTQPASLDDLIESLKEAWIEFQKTGSDALLQSVLQNGFSAAGGGSFNYLAVLQAGIGILGTMLGAEIPGVAVAAPILSMVIGWLWPHKTQDDTQQLINLIDAEIQKQLNKALSEQDKNNWTGYLNAIFQISNDASRSVVDAQFTGNEGDATRQPRTPGVSDYENVYNHLLATQGSLIVALSQMINGNFDTLAIPFFVIGATVQLSTYQSFIQFANKWLPIVYPDYQTQGTAGYTQQQNLINAKSDMRAAIQNHTQKVFNAFKAGLPSLSSDKNSISVYNQYVRGLVLNGLDTVATWPSMYPDDYRTQTELEQTRVIFSDLIGKDQTISNDVTLINMADGKNGSGAFNQHATIDLNSIFYYHEELSSIQLGIHDGNRGNTTNCYDYGIITNYPNYSYFYGDLYSPSGDATFSAPLNVLNAQTQYSSGYVDSEFIYNSDPSAYGAGCHILGGCTKGDCYNQSSCSEGFGYSCNPSLPSQKINAFYPFKMNLSRSGTSDKLGLMYSLVPLDLNPNNTFGELDSNTGNVIGKGFPAEKGTLASGNVPTVVREWVNGANAVKLSDDALTLKMTNMTGGKYYIRVRYANTSNAEISINQSVSAGNQNIQNGPWGLPSTITSVVSDASFKKLYIAGQTGNYVLEDITWGVDGQGKPITIPSGDVTVTLSRTNMSQSGDLFIDRVELVPMSLQTYTVNYTITSSLPSWDDFNHDANDINSFPTVWKADANQSVSKFIASAQDLPQLHSVVPIGLSTNGSWSELRDANLDDLISSGTQNVAYSMQDGSSFTELKLGSSEYQMAASSGTITGTLI